MYSFPVKRMASRHCKIVCIMQRMAYNDPAGFLQRHFSDTSTRVNVDEGRG